MSANVRGPRPRPLPQIPGSEAVSGDSLPPSLSQPAIIGDQSPADPQEQLRRLLAVAVLPPPPQPLPQQQPQQQQQVFNFDPATVASSVEPQSPPPRSPRALLSWATTKRSRSQGPPTATATAAPFPQSLLPLANNNTFFDDPAPATPTTPTTTAAQILHPRKSWMTGLRRKSASASSSSDDNQNHHGWYNNSTFQTNGSAPPMPSLEYKPFMHSQPTQISISMPAPNYHMNYLPSPALTPWTMPDTNMTTAGGVIGYSPPSPPESVFEGVSGPTTTTATAAAADETTGNSTRPSTNVKLPRAPTRRRGYSIPDAVSSDTIRMLPPATSFPFPLQAEQPKPVVGPVAPPRTVKPYVPGNSKSVDVNTKSNIRSEKRKSRSLDIMRFSVNPGIAVPTRTNVVAATAARPTTMFEDPLDYFHPPPPPPTPPMFMPPPPLPPLSFFPPSMFRRPPPPPLTLTPSSTLSQKQASRPVSFMKSADGSVVAFVPFEPAPPPLSASQEHIVASVQALVPPPRRLSPPPQLSPPAISAQMPAVQTPPQSPTISLSPPPPSTNVTEVPPTPSTNNPQTNFLTPPQSRKPPTLPPKPLRFTTLKQTIIPHSSPHPTHQQHHNHHQEIQLDTLPRRDTNDSDASSLSFGDGDDRVGGQLGVRPTIFLTVGEREMLGMDEGPIEG